MWSIKIATLFSKQEWNYTSWWLFIMGIKKIIIPLQDQDKVLNILHDTHPGICRMKSLARGYVWWPELVLVIETLNAVHVNCHAPSSTCSAIASMGVSKESKESLDQTSHWFCRSMFGRTYVSRFCCRLPWSSSNWYFHWGFSILWTGTYCFSHLLTGWCPGTVVISGTIVGMVTSTPSYQLAWGDLPVDSLRTEFPPTWEQN